MDKPAEIFDVAYKTGPDGPTAREMLLSITGKRRFASPRCIDKPLILYGAGNLGRMAKDWLRHTGMPFRYVVDACPAAHAHDPHWRGIPILAPHEVPERDKATSLLAICISTIPYAPLYRSLAAQGWQDLTPFYDIAETYRERHPLSNGWFAGRPDEDDVSNIGRVLTQWEDDISRAHHIQFLAWRYLREEWMFDDAPVTTDDRYFIPRVRPLLHERETFLDLGAHHGEASITFSKVVTGRFSRIVAVEPDQLNLNRLHENFGKAFSGDLLEKISVLEDVIADTSGPGRFMDGLGYASQLSPQGEAIRETTTIDRMHVAPTFIKAHLEGSEYRALQGGAGTLVACRPIVAATIYHNSLGLWKTPLWLMNTLRNYRFLLRLHGWCGTGLVMYALPEERKLHGQFH